MSKAPDKSPTALIAEAARKIDLSSEEIAIGIGRAILYRVSEEPERVSVSQLADALKGIASFTGAKGDNDGSNEDFFKMFQEDEDEA